MRPAPPSPVRGRRAPLTSAGPAVGPASPPLACAGSRWDAPGASATAARLPRPRAPAPPSGEEAPRHLGAAAESARCCKAGPPAPAPRHLATSPPPTSPPPTSPGQAEEAAGRPVLCVGSQEKEDVSEKYARDWGVQCTRVSVQSQERGRVCLANFSLLNDVSSVILGGVHLAPSSPP